MSDNLQKNIPVLDLSPEIEELWDELNAAFQRVMKSGQFIMGPEVDAFEAEAADYLGVKYAIGVNSGTDALVISLRALGIGRGDEVITTPFSFFATAESICNAGAKPVFVDIDEKTFNIDPALIEHAITSNTKAIMPVHLYGRPAEMDLIMDIAERHNLKVVEDCAQSFGARFQGKQTGSIGDAGAFSFFPSKNLGAFGDGGLIATNDKTVAELARMLRAHGSKKKYFNELIGYNSRLDSLQAALLRVKLPHVDRWNTNRRTIARHYSDLLASVPHVIAPDFTEGHVFHQYTLKLPQSARDDVQSQLATSGIGTMIYYPVPQDQLPVYANQYPRFPVSEKLAQQVLSLPISPSLTKEQQVQVTSHLRTVLGSESPLTLER